MVNTAKLINKLRSLNITDSEAQKAMKQIENKVDIKRNIKVIKERICGINIKEIYRMLQKGRELQK